MVTMRPCCWRRWPMDRHTSLATAARPWSDSDLAARHPGRVRTVVAHEPPAVELLADAAEHRARSQQVYQTYRSAGIGAAMQQFLAFSGLKGGPPPSPAGEPPSPENDGGNGAHGTKHGAVPRARTTADRRVRAGRRGVAHGIVAGCDCRRRSVRRSARVSRRSRAGRPAWYGDPPISPAITAGS